MNKLLIPAFCCSLLLSSCGLYSKYERPNVNTDNLYRDTASVSGYLSSNDTTTLGSTPWRSVFTDPKLQQLIDSGLKNNADLRTAAISITEAKAMLKAARLAFYPNLQFAGSGTLSSWDFQKATQAYSLPIEASWNVDLFGSLTNAKRSQLSALLQAQDYQRSVRTSLISNIANCYYTLLMLDKQLEITKNTEQLTKQTYDMMVSLKQAASTDESAVQSARANYYSVKASIPEIERQIRETENSLSLLLAESPRHIDRGTFDGQQLPSKFSTGVGVQVLANRPDVHRNEMKLAQCFYNVNAARAAFYPNLTISGSAAWSNQNGLVNPGKLLAAAVGSLTQPIFMRGQLTSNLRVAKAEEEAAFIAWQQSVLNAGSEVSNALTLYKTSNERSALMKTQIDALQRNVDVAQKMFKMSANYNYLNIISAQQSLLSAQLNQVSADFYKMQAVVNLYYALGGGAN